MIKSYACFSLILLADDCNLYVLIYLISETIALLTISLLMVNLSKFCHGINFNHILYVLDDGGRYTYQKQPEMCKWNCKKLAEAIQMALPLARTEPQLQRIFDDTFQEHYKAKMRKKVWIN